jgi:hypothetical protein
MNKQNELILTESALEDFKFFKMYMKKKIYFCFSSYLLLSESGSPLWLKSSH